MQPSLENASTGLLHTSPRPSKHHFGSADLSWDGLQLKLKRRAVVTVEPDSKWQGMYRVRCSGKLSDMVNLTRAKDAAVCIGLSELNSGE
jgi:hypothetical protein